MRGGFYGIYNRKIIKYISVCWDYPVRAYETKIRTTSLMPQYLDDMCYINFSRVFKIISGVSFIFCSNPLTPDIFFGIIFPKRFESVIIVFLIG